MLQDVTIRLDKLHSSMFKVGEGAWDEDVSKRSFVMVLSLRHSVAFMVDGGVQ